MLENLTESLQTSETDSLEKAFSRMGWCGFWALVVMGALPLIIMVYTFVFTGRPSGSSRSGLPFVQFFSTVGLLLSVFIALWFYRYTRIAKRIQDPASRPSESSLRRTVWTGLVATNLAILFSMLVLLFEVGTLLFYFLSAPQAGLPTVQTTVDWDRQLGLRGGHDEPDGGDPDPWRRDIRLDLRAPASFPNHAVIIGIGKGF